MYSDDVAYNGLYGLLPRQYVAAEFLERLEVFRYRTQHPGQSQQRSEWSDQHPLVRQLTGGVLFSPRTTNRVETSSIAPADMLSFADDTVRLMLGGRFQRIAQYDYNTGARQSLDWSVPFVRGLTATGAVVYTGSESANGANPRVFPPGRVSISAGVTGLPSPTSSLPFAAASRM